MQITSINEADNKVIYNDYLQNITGHKKDEKYRFAISITLILIIILFVIFVLSFTLGRYCIKINDLIITIYQRIIGDPNINMTNYRIVMYIRFPRIMLTMLVGASLSASGAVYQSLFQNPMASPDILGCSNGAATGAAIAILLNFSKIGITLVSFFCSLLSIFLVYIIANRFHSNKVLNLILSGIMISSIFSAITSYIKLIADPSNKLPAITYWLMGSFSGITLKELNYAIIPIVVTLIFLIKISWQLNTLSLSEDEAKSLGVNIKLYRIIFIIISTILTATSVAFSGTIGYVGLCVPHFSRKIIGNNNQYLIPISAINGAIFLLIVDNISRNLLISEIPIGILTSFIGAPFFIILLMRKDS